MTDAAPEPKRSFHVVLKVTPRGKGRPRATKTGRVYTPKETVAAEAEIRWLLQKERPPCFEGPVYLVAKVFFKRPKTVSPKKRPCHTTKPDGSNVAKTIEDACTGILYRDDAQIVTLHIEKHYADEDRIELLVGEV